MKRFNIKIIIYIFIMLFFFSSGQTKKEIEADMRELKINISDLEKKMEKEEYYYKKFMEEKEVLLSQKKLEKKELISEIRKIERERGVLNNEAREVEIKIRSLQGQEDLINGLIRRAAAEEQERVLKGIPFEQDRRAGSLSALVLDIDNGKAGAIESFNRFMGFYNSEEVSAYDSQVIQTIISVGGKPVNTALLRIGHVFFAADAGEHVYLYSADDHTPDTETVLTIAEKRNIRSIIAIIQGKNAPDFIEIPVFMHDISYRKEVK
ncbi:DUF3450 family protein [Spirochaetota bacterium]